MKTTYPVLLTRTENCILVEVPDFDILTEGTDYTNAIEMARDAIGLTDISMEDHKEPIPSPSALTDISARSGTFSKDGDTIVNLIDIDFSIYRRKLDNRTVRKNVSLPSWLNYEAECAGINVSRVLQEALMNTLGVSR